MENYKPKSFALQALLFTSEEISCCFFREPSERELEFMSFFQTLQSLLTVKEYHQLCRRQKKGRPGYDLLTILGIQLLQLHFKQPTMKETLLLLIENSNLRDILSLKKVPSCSTVSRLSRQVEGIVNPQLIHHRLIQLFQKELDDRIVGNLSIDSTIIEAREKPVSSKKEIKNNASSKKRGPKKKGSSEERKYRAQQATLERQKVKYLRESPQKNIKKLEKRCSRTAKQNSKGKLQWFVGYKAHLATDDFGIPIAYAVTGACVHDSQVAVPLMKMVYKRADFYYALMDKGYINPQINAYANLIGRKVIIDQRQYKGVAPMAQSEKIRYKARTTVERTNSELKDGFLPNKLYRKKSHARYDIELSILLLTMKKIKKILLLKDQTKAIA
jgi:hypothetical protein